MADMHTGSMEHVALEEAALDARLKAWQDDMPALSVVALLPEAEADRLPLLQACCRARGVTLAGAIFPQLVDGDRLLAHGVWLMAQPGALPYALIPALPAQADEAGACIAQAVEALLAPASGAARPLLGLIFDGQLGHIGSVLDALYLRLADRVTYFGANAGSETFQPMPCLFDAHRVVGDGVLCLVLDAQVKTALAHGYPVPDHLMSASATQGNRVETIDWQPAFDAYRALIRERHGIELTAENFYQYAVHFPFGLLRANGEVLVRIPVSLGASGELTCIGEVPDQAMLVVIPAPPAHQMHCTTEIARALGPQAHGQPALVFYCAGRRLHMGEAVADELRDLRQRLGCTTLAGALSLGEVGNTASWGYPMFHNAALVCASWPTA